MANPEVEPARHGPLRVILLALFAASVLRTAWMCDDAFITFRTVENFVAGHGLVWNVGERVQTYTHPLWMLVCSAAYAITGEMYHTVLAVQLALAVAAAALLAWQPRSRAGLALVALGLLLPKGSLEWSTSGLENPLTHVLLLAFAREALDAEPRPGRLGAWFGLLCLNRLDACLLVLPFLAWLAARRGARAMPRIVAGLAPGLLPMLAWEVFSFVYYGFPVPNTAFAKLGTGVPHGELFAQGWWYLANALVRDPLVPMALLAAMGAAAARARRDPAAAALAAGIALHLVYLLRIGGDFMTGRMLSAPYLLALALLTRALPTLADARLAVVLVIAAHFAPSPPFLYNVDYSGGVRDNKGISDEAKFYGPATGLMVMNRQLDSLGLVPAFAWADEGRQAARAGGVVTRNAVGMFGYCAGPNVHVVDLLALCDPLLARLPAAYDHDWHIGHFERALPDGYLETLKTGADHFTDARLGAYYALLKRVISGPIWDLERLRIALELNLGRHDHLIDVDRYRYPGYLVLHEEAVAHPFARGTMWDAGGVTKLTTSGARVVLKHTSHAGHLEVSLDNNDVYLLRFLREGKEVGALQLGPHPSWGLEVYNDEVPATARDEGFDTVWVMPLGSDGKYSLGHLRLSP